MLRHASLVTATAALLLAGAAPPASAWVGAIECTGIWTIRFDPPLTLAPEWHAVRLYGGNTCAYSFVPGFSGVTPVWMDTTFGFFGSCSANAWVLAEGHVLHLDAAGLAFFGTWLDGNGNPWHFLAGFATLDVCNVVWAQGVGLIGVEGYG